MKYFTDFCLHLGKTVYSFQMRYFGIAVGLWGILIIMLVTWRIAFDTLAPFFGKYYDNDSSIVCVFPDDTSNKDSSEARILITRTGFFVSSGREMISPHCPIFIVLSLFPVFTWLFLGWFTVGASIVMKSKRILDKIWMSLTLINPYTISLEFRNRERRYLFPFQTNGNHRDTSGVRQFLLVYYVCWGLGLSLFALSFEHPQKTLLQAWLMGGIFVIVYSALLHSLVVAIYYRKSQVMLLNVWICSVQHACIGGVVFPLFPLTISFVMYGIYAAPILWTIYWLVLVFLFIPIVSSGYIVTFISIFTLLARGIASRLQFR